jgi:acetylornithine deacetylase/succinyl-diaminopimelate desuccinylase-like protein
VATCDEEDGDHCGAKWLVETMPDLVRADYLLNEGGGEFTDLGDRLLYPLTVGEKGFAQFKIRTRGQAGHGSVPLHELNPVQKLARVITALVDYELPVTVGPFTAEYIDLLVADPDLRRRLKDPARARAAIRALHERGDKAAFAIEPLLGITFSPTIVRGGGEAVNVIPSHAEVDVDCRILPQQKPAEVEAAVKAALAPLGDGWEFEWVDVTISNESPAPTPLSESLERVLRRAVPTARMLPLHLSGFTDSRWFREAFPGIVAYGFCPFRYEDSETMGERCHGIDERIAADDVAFQAWYAEQVARDLLG